MEMAPASRARGEKRQEVHLANRVACKDMRYREERYTGTEAGVKYNEKSSYNVKIMHTHIFNIVHSYLINSCEYSISR